MSLDRLFFKYGVYLPVTLARGERFLGYLNAFEQSQWANPAVVRDLQERKLNTLVDWASTRVPLYRERIDRSRLPKRLTLDDLPSLPTLSKADLRDRATELTVDCGERTTVKTTGGSTGQAVTVTKSRSATAQELAAMWRGWRWGGVDIGDRQARFWGVPLSSRGRFRARLIDFVAHRRRFSAFRLAEGDMATYTTELNRYRPDFVYGYVSILVEYANYLESAGTRRFTPKAIFATSEVLTPQHRSAIERGFGGRVFEEYGCGELGNLAHECEKGSLHISAENMVVEIVPAAAGNSAGEIIVTELNNLAMPLLRYRLNDFASPIDGACACGRKLPRIGDVVGRAYDVIYNRDGRMFHGEFFMYIFEEVKQKGLGVQRFQVIQHDFDHFTIRVQPGPGYGPETEAFVRRRPIVAIGASAGGLEAITQLLKNLPPDTGMAYVYIQHLDPTHESMLSTILAKSTSMKVMQAEHLVRIAPDHLFIIPPDKNMSIIDGVINLHERKPRPAINMPIDQFFVSLAERQKEGAIGVVLSGTATDGTIGLKAIKAAGGFTFVQDESAKFQSMPKSAIAEGVVDMILSPAAIAAELERLSKKTELMSKVISLPEEAENADGVAQDTPIDNEADISSIIKLLKKATTVDFLHYKRSTICRRILRRMLLHKIDTAKEYVQYLLQHPGETNLLFEDLFIHVTSFFRDQEAMEYLQKTLIPKILNSKQSNEPIRIWIPACSTGEEAYSMAIILLELLAEYESRTPIQIFATDISELAITKARLGLYSKNELANVSPARLQRFFTRVDGSYRIHKSIRDLCIFAPHNIFRDPPFSRLDLISCCNLMIYLDNFLQKKAIATFYYALNPAGYLVLGKSETIGSSGQLFVQLEKTFRIFAKKHEASGKASIDLSNRLSDHERSSPEHKRIQDEPAVSELEKLVDNILLSKYVPASVVVNLDLEILQFRGSTGFFLEPSPGKASLNLVKMAKPGLSFELRNAIHKANKLRQTVRKSDLEIKYKDAIHRASIEVVPLKSDSEERLFLVLFEELQPVSSDPNASLSRDEHIRKLQEELISVREDMRSIIEDQEASTEELQSANEEIISSNEELHSVNEELETSKEEVEATNEELMTINTELQVRNEQLAESYEYAEALLDTIREAVIVLGQDLRVKMANKAFYQNFTVTEHETVGHTLFELGNRQWDILKLRQLLDDVINNDVNFSGLEIEHNFPNIGEKTMLLNARKVVQKTHQQEVILMAIEDITEHRAAQKIMTERETWFRNMADNAPVMIWMTDPNREWTFVNSTWLQYTGAKLPDVTGAGWLNTIHEDDRESAYQHYKSHFDKKLPFDMESRFRRNDGEYRWVLCTGKPTFSPERQFTGYIGSCTDIHDKKILFERLDHEVQQRTRELEEMNKELSRSNSELQQFAYVASHDLQEPLRKIMTFSDKLQQHAERIPEEGRVYIEKITSSSHRMTRLIDDLLNFSRISRSNRKFTRIDLNDIVKDVMVDFELIILQKKAKIEFDKLPVIQAIPLQMEQLFHNLISNALKFSKSNVPPVISISSRSISQQEAKDRNLRKPGSYIEIIVADNGIGFNPEFSEQIFTIFQRLNSKYEYPGTGIGLALCRKIALNHEGEMWAEAAPDEGARFYIILPVNHNPSSM